MPDAIGARHAPARDVGSLIDDGHYHRTAPVVSAETVKITVTANAYGIVRRWWSARSTPARPTSRKVAGVSGLTGNPVVICPSTAARAVSMAEPPAASDARASTGIRPK